MTLKISKQRLLIVEGRDEEQFFDAAMNHLGIATVQISGIGGKTKLTSNLKAVVRPWSAECFSPLWQFLRVLSGG